MTAPFSPNPVDARRIMLRQALHDVPLAAAREDIAAYYWERVREHPISSADAAYLTWLSNELGRIAHEAGRRQFER